MGSSFFCVFFWSPAFFFFFFQQQQNSSFFCFHLFLLAKISPSSFSFTNPPFSLGCLPRLRGSLRLPWRPRLQRQGVEPRLQLAAERVVDEPVPRDGVFPLERLGDGLDAEVRLRVGRSRGVAGVARVEVGLVGDGEGDGGEGGLELAACEREFLFFLLSEEGGGCRRSRLREGIDGCERRKRGKKLSPFSLSPLLSASFSHVLIAVSTGPAIAAATARRMRRQKEGRERTGE